MDFEVLAEGLQFPEGPIAMDDGSVILVEIARGTLTRVWNGKTEVIANLGGGPNGAALGPDGAVYVCNNGGFRWYLRDGLRYPGNAADDYTTGRIERVDLNTGKFERLYDSFEGERLGGPNDLVFDRHGGFWFTDLGKRFARTRDHSGLYYATPDGTSLRKAIYPAVSFNGVGLSPDESIVYCNDTDLGKVFFAHIESPGQLTKPGPIGARAKVLASLPGYQLLDSLAVEANGNICAATLFNGGITVVTPTGECEHIAFPDPLVTNICFGGEDMCDAYITLSASGKLIKTRWPRPGLRLNFSR